MNAKFLFLLCGMALLSASGRADWVIVQQVDSGGPAGTVTLKLKGQRMRADLDAGLTTLSDGASGEVITLVHSRKRFMRIPAERVRALGEKLEKLQEATPAGSSGGAPGPPQLVFTGKKVRLGTAECEIFSWNARGLHATYWVARGFPGAAKIMAALAGSFGSGLGALAPKLSPKPGDFPGMVLKTEMVFAGRKVTSAVLSVSEEPLDDGWFRVPADYTEAPSPDFAVPGKSP